MCACASIAASFKPNPAPIVQLSLSDCTKISSRRLGAGCETSSIPPSIMYLGVDSHTLCDNITLTFRFVPFRSVSFLKND